MSCRSEEMDAFSIADINLSLEKGSVEQELLTLLPLARFPPALEHRPDFKREITL